MKVAIMGESIQSNMNGQGWFTYYLVKNLSKIKNIDLTVIGDNYLENIDIKVKKLIHKMKKNTIEKLIFYKDLKMIKKEKFDIIHSPVNYGHPYFWFADALKVKTIHDATGFEIKFNYPLTYKIQLKTQFKIFGKKINKIATISETSKKEINKHFHFPIENIDVIYNGVSSNFRPIDKKSCKKVLDKYNVKMPFVFHISNASHIKNIDGIIKAYQKIKDTTRCNLVIGGAWKGNSTDRIISAGYIDFEDLPYFYSAAEVFVFPSFHEGFGLPVLEAMASGTPVITSNIYATKEIASDSAILVNPYNTNEISKAICNLINDNDLHEYYRRKGLNNVKKFSWKKCAQSYADLYFNLLNKHNEDSNYGKRSR